WSVNKWEVLNAIDAELARRHSAQGEHYQPVEKVEQS
ncbi:TIGR01212 family radical SAM protein, partial [Burkholderia multivorans]